MTPASFDPESLPTVSVVIPSASGAHLLARCLASLRPPSGGTLEVIVVDAGSCDGTRAACAAAPLPVRIVDLGHNVGFARAVNAGVAAAHGRRVLLLNNDTVAGPALVDRLLAAAEDTGAALVVPRVLSLTEPSRIDNTGNELYPDGLNLCRGRGELDGPRHRVPLAPLLPSGCAVLIDRVLWARIGGFDARLYAYGEDAELGLRAARAGLRAAYAPDAVVHHLGGGTWGAASLRKAFLVERNRARLAWIHLPAAALARSPLHLAARYREHARAATRGAGPTAAYPGGWRRGAAVLAAAAGAVAALPHLPADLRRRAEIDAQSSLDRERWAALLRRRLVGVGALRERTRW